MTTLKPQKHLFDIPEDIAYFNCAYNSPLLKKSVTALQKGVVSKSHPWERMPNDFFDDADAIRNLAAELFGGDADGYAIIPAVSYGMSTVARIFEPKLKSGDEILLMDEDFPSVVLPFQRVANETGAKLTTVKTPNDGNWTNAIIAAINKNTKIVSIASCHWTNGAYIDLKAVSEQCKKLGAVLAVDATQTLGAAPFSMDEVQPDFLIAAGYKWLLCPYGFSIMYVHEKWRNERPLEETWIAREQADNFANLVNYNPNYMAGARRFEVGQKCTPTILPGAIEALKQIKEWGIENIAETLATINKSIASELNDLGFKLPPDHLRNPHMFGAVLPKKYKGDILTSLKNQNIYISQRGNALRFAPHVYINHYDINRLIETIRIEK